MSERPRAAWGPAPFGGRRLQAGLAAALAALACTAAGRTGSAPAKDAAGRPLRVTLAVPQDVGSGDPIPARLILVNGSSEPVTLRFSSGQRYDFTVQDASGRAVWRWADGRAFTMALGGETLPAGGSLVYEERLDPDLAAGLYTIRGTITALDSDLEAAAALRVRPKDRAGDGRPGRPL